MKRRKDIPTIICRGCGHGMQGEEVTSFEGMSAHYIALLEGQEKAVINWTCQNRQCPYGPKTIPVGDELED